MLIEEKGSSTTCEIPKHLYMSLVRIQASKALGWSEACKAAATILEEKELEFERRVKSQAEKLYNSRFMTQLNQAKRPAYDEGYKAAVTRAMLKTICSRCGKDIEWDTTNEATRAILMKIMEAGGVRNWFHGNCKNRNIETV